MNTDQVSQGSHAEHRDTLDQGKNDPTMQKTEINSAVIPETKIDRSTSISSGGAGTSLDLTTEKDRGLVRTAMKSWPKRWRGLTAEFKDKIIEDLETVRKRATEFPETMSDPLNGAKVLLSVAKTAAMMEAQHQSDEHLEDKNSRLDAGQSTENQKITVVHENRIHDPE